MDLERLANIVGRPEFDGVPLGSSLVDDIGLDSLELIEIVLLLEDHTGKDLDPGLIESVRTVRDLLEWF